MNQFAPKSRFWKRPAPVRRTGSWWPDLEMGRGRFPALQHRRSNLGRTPDRSLSLKQRGFMRLQGKRFQCLAWGRNGDRLADDGASLRAWSQPIAPAGALWGKTPESGVASVAERSACQSEAPGLWNRCTRRTGRGPAMAARSLVSFGPNEVRQRRLRAAGGENRQRPQTNK